MYHLASGLLPLSLVGLLLQHVQNLVASGAVLKRKLADDLTQLVDPHLLGFMQRQAHVQEKLVISVKQSRVEMK